MFVKDDCSQEIALLKKRYNECAEKVGSELGLRRLADEKMLHSLQVVGAGNFILKHEKTWELKNSEQCRRAKLAYLFHDIGRFAEIEAMLQTDNPADREFGKLPGISHGMLGADYLRRFRQYDLPEIIIPVKRHCDLPDLFYTDEELAEITDNNLRQDIIDNYRLTCDADKIANFALCTRSYYKLKAVFYGHLTPEEVYAPISSAVLECFNRESLVPSSSAVSLCDRILSVLCWIYDLNYRPSFEFCLRLNLFEKMLRILRDHNPDRPLQQDIETKTADFLRKKIAQI